MKTNLPAKLKGFSLIELIIVVGLTSLLAIAITSVAMTSLLGAARIRNLVKTRQSGDNALNQIQTKIRNARNITTCNSTTNTITIENLDGNTTTYLVELDGAAMRIASNSGQYITPSDTTISSFDIECSPSDAEPNLVTIKYQITNTVQGARSQETPTIPYETAIQIRN